MCSVAHVSFQGAIDNSGQAAWFIVVHFLRIRVARFTSRRVVDSPHREFLLEDEFPDSDHYELRLSSAGTHGLLRRFHVDCVYQMPFFMASVVERGSSKCVLQNNFFQRQLSGLGPGFFGTFADGYHGSHDVVLWESD